MTADVLFMWFAMPYDYSIVTFDFIDF